MIVPDQSHIDRVRDALWQRSRGGASVMVGSGFSRNALKTRPDAEDLPMWRGVAREMSNKLYPPSAKESQHDEIAKKYASNDPLSLAEEYKTAFGRTDLHSFLQQQVRDDDFKPGDTHIRLLRLPWRDVFTTNWDTLLEQARTSVADRAYSVVRNMDEIPLANRPRIVKLHGSLPAYFPLIVTEEDYRTYPTQFAPFVNTVQQAMMETVFCLIGFSGNDPNFLHWSGWVRDNLGSAAPKIYLAGWLDLSTHRRRMLEDRNVVPIDLAHHPKAGQWPEHLRHDYATEWILHTLERGHPYNVTDWPSPRSQQYSSIPEHLQPIHELVSEVPKEGPMDRSEIASEDLQERVRQTLAVWTHNRTIYPNWLVVPNSVRHGLSRHTDEWEPRILRVLPDFAPVEKLKAIRELMWRTEILLDPISSQLESAAKEALHSIDCQTRTIDGVADSEIEWATVREAWRTIALALVTVARHRFDRNAFDQRIEALSLFLDDDSDVAHRIHHERCLWTLYSMDFKALDDLLEAWRTENCDPAWMMRKAALLFETGRNNEAARLIEHALATIREMPADDRSVAGPSRESWALWSAWQSGDWQAIRRRWDELTPLKCNALSEKRNYANALEASNKKKDAPLFDLGRQRSPGFHWSSEESERRVAAYRAIRLSEVAGLPPSVNHMSVASDILKLATDELSTSEPEMAARMVLRIVDYDRDPLLKRVLSRSRVATLPEDSARTLAEICKGVIEFALPRIVGARSRAVFWIERMRVAMEVLSRLVLRLDLHSMETIFDKALELYRNDYIARDPWLTDPVRNMLKRSWEALPEDRRTTRVLEVLNARIVGMDNFTASNTDYPDPGELLQDDLPLPIRTDANEDRWQEIVSLLVRGLRTGGEARERASLRIAPVSLGGLLTETELSQAAQALWSEKHTGPNDLPGETLLFDWVFLLLPEPEPGLAERCFRYKWLAVSRVPQEDSPSLDDILWQVGNAISGLKKYGRLLDLSEDERFYLTQVIEQWSAIQVPRDFFPLTENELREPTHRALNGLPSILAAIHLPEIIGEKLYEKLQTLNESGLPGFKLVAGLVKAMPNRFEEIVLLIRMGLVSDNINLAEGATVGFYHWLTTSAEIASEIQPPPDDFVREIGFMIATRRKVCLGHALQIAKWVFDQGSDVQKAAIRDLVLQGLGYLVEELRYDSELDRDDNIDVPLLRWRSAQLASSMANDGFEDTPAVSRWLEIVKDDPLPEVRYANRPAFVRH